MNKTLLIFILLFSLNFAASNDVADIISQSQNAYIIILLVFMLSALMYMGGSIFSVPNWIARSKDMLYQGIFSLVLMASFPALYSIISSIFSSLFLGNYGAPNMSMFDLSEGLLFWNYIYYFIHLIMVTMINLFVMTFFGKSLSIPIANRVVPFDLTVLQSPLLFIVNTMVGIISFSIMINGFQLLFLNFVHYTLIPFLLPIGLLLRAFPTSMHAGNVLVGISIAAFIIVPLVYAIDLQILPQIVASGNLNKNNFKTYDSFALMRFFYNQATLENVVIKQTQCGLINEAKDIFGYGFVSADSAANLQTTGEGCGIDIMDATNIYLESASTTSVVVGSTVFGAAMITKTINTMVGLLNTFKTSKITTPFLYNVFSGAVSGVALGYIIYFSSQILLGIIISFVVLSAILPFLKFTIIIIFIREFTYNILGTQISLGQITRLL